MPKAMRRAGPPAMDALHTAYSLCVRCVALWVDTQVYLRTPAIDACVYMIEPRILFDKLLTQIVNFTVGEVWVWGGRSPPQTPTLKCKVRKNHILGDSVLCYNTGIFTCRPLLD